MEHNQDNGNRNGEAMKRERDISEASSIAAILNGSNKHTKVEQLVNEREDESSITSISSLIDMSYEEQFQRVKSSSLTSVSSDHQSKHPSILTSASVSSMRSEFDEKSCLIEPATNTATSLSCDRRLVESTLVVDDFQIPIRQRTFERKKFQSISLDNIKNLNERKFKLYQRRLIHAVPENKPSELIDSSEYSTRNGIFFEESDGCINKSDRNGSQETLDVNDDSRPITTCIVPLGSRKACQIEKYQMSLSIEKLYKQISEKEKAIGDQEQEINHLKKINLDLKKRFEEFSSESEQNEDKLDQELELCKKQVLELEGQVKAMQKEEKKSRKLKEKLDETQQELEEKTSQNSTVLSEVNRLKKEVEKKVKELERKQRLLIEEQRNENCLNQRQVIEEELNLKNEKLDSLINEINELKDYKSLLEKRLDQIDRSFYNETQDLMDVDLSEVTQQNVSKLLFFECNENAEKQSKCGVPKCKGIGNINEKFTTHTRITIDELNSKIKELNQEKEVFRKSIDNFKTQEQLYNADLLNKKSEIDRYIAQLKELNEELEILKNEVTSLRDLKTSDSAEIGRLNGIIINKNDNIKRLELQISSKDSLVAADYNAFEQLRDKYKNLEKILKQKEQELNKSIDSLTFERDENKVIKKQLAELKENYRGLREKSIQKDSIEEEFRLNERNLVNEYEKLKNKHKKACDELADSRLKLESIDFLQKEKDKYKQRLAETKQKYEELLLIGNEDDALSTQINILQAENDSLKKKINDKCIAYSQDTERLEDQLSELKIENRKLSSLVEQLKGKQEEASHVSHLKAQFESNIDDRPPSYGQEARHFVISQSPDLPKVASSITSCSVELKYVDRPDDLPENVCEKCFRVCKGYAGKRIHQGRNPNCDKKDEEEVQYVKCLYCDKRFYNVAGANFHILKDHPGRKRMS